jgi:hypothetical protein
MAISSIPELNCEQTLEVILSNTKPGDYQLSFTELDRLDLPYAIELIDIYTGSTEQVLNNSIYQFKVSDDSATYKSRFELSVLPEKLIIQSVTHGHNCTAGPVKLTAVANYSEVPGLQYSWYQDAQIEAPIEVNNTGEFITPELTNSRSYFVSVTGATGCQSEKVEVLATIEQHDTPKINLEAQNILISNYQSGNQWYFNGSAILNANKDILRLDKPGIYRLEVTISQCQFYDEIEIHPADLSPDGNSLIVYPTPAANLLNLSLLQVEDRNVQIAVYNALGKLASTKRLAVYNRKAQLDISHINPGVYFIEVHIDENKYTTRFIKL